REDTGRFSLFFNRAWSAIFRWYPQVLLWFRKDNPDLIHAHLGTYGCYILPYARLLNIPLVTSFYGADAYMLSQQVRWQKKYKKLFKQGRLFIAEGPAMRKKLIDIGCPPKKIVIHHIGIKLENYKFHIRKPDEEVRLLVCGRFMEKKGIPYAIEALSRLKLKSGPNVRLTIVGDSDEKGTLTDEKRKILDSIKKHNLADMVTITGYVSHDELLKITHDHHIFLSPSVHASNGDAEGGFPVILTEALATGMPIVAFDHCDIPQIVQDGKTGFIVPEKDVDALADKLSFLIEHPEVWSEMGQSGRKLVEEEYDITKLNKELSQIYSDLRDEKYY
ncbi:MAG: glycosyltransferase, partial [Candidatus Omnitrophota bacterium]